MFKTGCEVIQTMFRYARKSCCLRSLQRAFQAVLPMMMIVSMQMVVVEVEAFLTKAPHHMGGAIILLLILIVINAVCEASNQYINVLTEKQLSEKFTDTIIEKFKNIKYEYYEDLELHNVIKRVGSKFHLILRDYFNDMSEILSLAVSAATLFFIFLDLSFFFACTYLLCVAVMTFCHVKTTNKTNAMYYEQTLEERKLSYLTELLSNKQSLSELKVFQAVTYIRDKWYRLNEVVLKVRTQGTISAQKYQLFCSFFFVAWIVLFFALSIRAVVEHNIDFGAIVVLVAAIGNAYFFSQRIAENFTSITKKQFDISLYNSLMLLDDAVPGESVADISDKIEIEFRNVTFSYPESEEIILDNVSFRFTNKEHIALVGANGAGKSTIIKLLCRLYQPISGQVIINQVNLYDLDPKQFHKLLCVVFQDFGCYWLTLRENIALGDIAKINDDAALARAMQLGMLQHYNIPLSTPLGKLESDGVDISGGQWQRIAIARACISESQFIILDEPTAALDPMAESELYENFMGLTKYRGCIIVSHRLASAKLADRILVLDQGKIVENGAHTELLKNRGLYAKMFKAQESWY